MNTPALSLIAVLTLASTAFALDPPPGGGYPGETTALGDDALLNLNPTATAQDTALGYQALYETTTGGGNVGVGAYALHNNTEGEANTAVGFNSLYGNTTGKYNVAIGPNAMVSNTTALGGTAVGYTALQANTTGFQNTAIGFGAMTFSTGAYNTALGGDAMSFNIGSYNVALGNGALNMGGSGSNNTAVGFDAGVTLTGNNNIVLGYNAASSLTQSNNSNNIEIGTAGMAHDANVIRLGDPAVQSKAFIAGISRATVSGGVAVMVTSKGQLGVATSSARFKDNIQPMKNASDAILSLKPVTFRYKKELDPQAIPQFGLVAEDVAKVAPDLVARDDDGKPYTVRYEAVNAMLLNEFLKEHKKVEEQSALLARQEERLERLESLIGTAKSQ